MRSNELDKFTDVWSHFEALVRGKLSDKLKSEKVDVNFANIILDKAALIWFSGTGVEGKWLADYKLAEPEKGKEISEVLHNELSFFDNATQNNGGNYIKYGVPVAGGIAVGAIAKTLGVGGPLARTLGAGAVAAAMYPIAKGYSEDATRKSKNAVVDAYIEQLQQCKGKIEKILER